MAFPHFSDLVHLPVGLVIRVSEVDPCSSHLKQVSMLQPARSKVLCPAWKSAHKGSLLKYELEQLFPGLGNKEASVTADIVTKLMFIWALEHEWEGMFWVQDKHHLTWYFFPSPSREETSRYIGKFKTIQTLFCLNPNNFFYSCVSLEDLAARYQHLVGKSQEKF